jgi:hypothetical protein
MRRALLLLAVPPLVSVAFFTALVSGCDEQPRGEQGIDYLIDGSFSSTPPGHDAGSDAHPVCQEENDPRGICAEASTSVPPASHLIVCSNGQAPVGIMCVAGAGQDASADAGTFCCTTGLL